MNFTNTDCVKKEVKFYSHGFEQFHKQVELPLIRKTDLDLWEWVLAQIPTKSATQSQRKTSDEFH